MDEAYTIVRVEGAGCVRAALALSEALPIECGDACEALKRAMDGGMRGEFNDATADAEGGLSLQLVEDAAHHLEFMGGALKLLSDALKRRLDDDPEELGLQLELSSPTGSGIFPGSKEGAASRLRAFAAACRRVIGKDADPHLYRRGAWYY